MFKNILFIFQILISILLIAVIIIQSQGTGLGSAWGGGGESYRSKRGAEKVLFITTIIFAGLFLLSSILIILI